MEDRQHDVIDSLPPDGIKERHFAAGETIFQEGEDAEWVYIIEKGQVEISIEENGEKFILDERGMDSIFGEMALIDGGSRSATATALVDTRCYVLNKENFTRYLMELNPFAYRIFQTLTATIRKMNRDRK